jgi:hypothetical protein
VNPHELGWIGLTSASMSNFAPVPEASGGGEPKPDPLKGCGAGCLSLIGLFAVLILIAVMGDDDNEGGTSGPALARAMCEGFVEKQLRAPSTAGFSGVLDTTVAPSGPSAYRVSGYVDAENGFGAQIRTDYVCEVREDGDTWTLLDLQTS